MFKKICALLINKPKPESVAETTFPVKKKPTVKKATTRPTKKIAKKTVKKAK